MRYIYVYINIGIKTGRYVKKRKYSRAFRGLEWPRWFQKFKVPRFQEDSTGWW